MAGLVRSQPRRSAARSAASLPYARPKQAPPKKSAWSIASDLFNYLNPLRARSTSRSISPIDVDDEEEPESTPPSDESPPASLSARGRQMAKNLAGPAQPPMEPAMPSLLADSSSPKKNLDTVAAFLEQRRGQTISPLEAEGLISLIHKSTLVEEEKPFRFSSSPSTPARGNSPAAPNDIFTLGASSSTPALGNTPRKALSKNPNGVYRWSGGGSARPSKNRYASPAFGTSPRASPDRMVFRDQPVQKEVASPKRRRLETPPAATPPPVPRSAAPAPSPNRVAASQYFPFPPATPAPSPSSPSPQAVTAATPARNAMVKVQSAPAHPSPLRQAWGGSPASSVSSTHSSPAQGTPTKAAVLLTALIRDADAEAPPKSLDVRNPYQSASPVPVRVTNTHPPEAATRKRARATGRPAERKAREAKEKEEKAAKEKEKEEQEKVKQLSPQAIIEATVPKGSRRSRPPAHMTTSASLNNLAPPALPAPRRSPRLEPQRIEGEVDLDGEGDAEEKDKEEHDAGAPAPKRARLPTVNGNTLDLPKKDAEPMSVPASSVLFAPASTPGADATSNASPSPLGNAFGFRPGPKPLAASAPKEPSKLRYSYQPPATPPPVVDSKPRELFPMDPPAPPAKAAAPAPAFASTSKDPKDMVRSMAPSTLPSFVLTVLTNTPSMEHAKARDLARGLDKSALPKFDLPVSEKGKAREEQPVVAAGESWMCDTCMLTNGAEVKDKCKICDSPRPAAAKPAPKQGFNWAAEGMAPPKQKPAGEWTCGTCMLSNMPDYQKCTVCDSPRG
ncbi:hypothetical protein FB45DRAFT_797684 [Roridomyces roridus]|uniref:RanBP2-type domain-containing protein n=1 Tax=Roridomyces roridus TaxID=1738132 RepID=A0AAD7FGV0_9AGAR|nr:hypothetical protein FB45DRAFT_797684 [Roridomyces roridus]